MNIERGKYNNNNNLLDFFVLMQFVSYCFLEDDLCLVWKELFPLLSPITAFP